MATRVTDGARWERLPPSLRASRGFAACARVHSPYKICRKRETARSLRVWRDSRVILAFKHPAATWFVAREVWFVGDEMGNTAFQLVLYQCCKTSCTFFSPVCGILKLENLGDLLYLLKDTGEKNWWLISEESNATLHLSIRGDKTYKIPRSCKHKPTNILSFYYLAGALPGRNFYSPL